MFASFTIEIIEEKVLPRSMEVVLKSLIASNWTP